MMRMFVAVSAFLLLAATASAQSLVDVAKAERERRAASPTAPRSWTNADLKPYPETAAPAPTFDAWRYAPPPLDFSGPTVTVIPYDRYWPFDGPPSSLAPPTPPNVTYVTHLGGYGYGYGGYYRRGSRGFYERSNDDGLRKGIGPRANVGSGHVSRRSRVAR